MEVDKYIRDFRISGSCVLCLGRCKAGISLVCSACRLDLSDPSEHCETCTRGLGKGRQCVHCLKHPPVVQRICYASTYDELSAKLIGAYKFEGRAEFASVLAEIFCARFDDRSEIIPDAIVPVPLHGNRLRTRGFDQALLLANHIGNRLNLTVDARWVTRIRATPQQSELGNKARLSNVRNAFATNGARAYRKIVILDDVITTGATVNAVAASLARPDRTIHAWSFAGASL